MYKNETTVVKTAKKNEDFIATMHNNGIPLLDP